MELRGGYLSVLGLRFALLCDVAASMVLAVAAAAIHSELDVAASFWLAVAAAALGLDDPALYVSTLVQYILVLFLVAQLLRSLLKVCEDGVSSASREGSIRNQSSSPWVRSPGRQCLVSTLHCLCLYFSPHCPARGVEVRASHLVALGPDPYLLLGLWTGMGSIDEIIVQGDGSKASFVAHHSAFRFRRGAPSIVADDPCGRRRVHSHSVDGKTRGDDCIRSASRRGDRRSCAYD